MSEIDYRRRSEEMHRRAQKAEARAAKLEFDKNHWFNAWYREIRSTGARHVRDLTLRLRAAEANASDPLRRIIDIGKRFP